jgi:hypothetical protein
MFVAVRLAARVAAALRPAILRFAVLRFVLRACFRRFAMMNVRS